MPQPTEVLADWLDAVLPARAEHALVQRGDAPLRVDDEGYVRVALLGALLACGTVAEAAEVEVALVHLEDVDEVARTRAFLAGWSRALAARLERIGEDASLAEVTELCRGHGPALEDLDLVTGDDFAQALERRRWLDSRPDSTVYPDFDQVPSPIASDPGRERMLAETGDEAALSGYLEWLRERGDPRGQLGQWMRSPRKMDQRRASQLLRAERGYLAGPFPIGEPGEPWGEVELLFRDGFIESAFVRLTLDADAPPPATIVRALFALPTARLVRSVKVAVDPFADEAPALHELPRLCDALVVPSDSLRTLELERHPDLQTLPEDEAALARRFPNLESLSIL